MTSRPASASARVLRNRNRNRNRASFPILIENHQHPLRDDVQRSPPWFLVYSALTQVEVGILQVYSQGSWPFNTHPANMWTFMIGMYTNFGAALYYGKCWLTGSRCPKICDVVGSITGSLASAAFLSILVPHSFETFVFIIWMLQSLMDIDVARNWIVEVAKKLYGYISNGAVHVWNRISGSRNETNLPN